MTINDKLIPDKYKQGLSDITDLKGYTLYDGNGVVSPVQLSDYVTNYNRVDVYASVDNAASYGLASASIFPAISSKGMLIVTSAGNGWAGIHCYRFKITNKTFEKETDATLGSGGSWSTPSTDVIKIYKIIGYK